MSPLEKVLINTEVCGDIKARCSCWHVKGGLCCLQQLPDVSSRLASLIHWNKHREQLQAQFFHHLLLVGSVSPPCFPVKGSKNKR